MLGALYMLWFAQRFLFGAAKAPHLPLLDLNLREKAILATIVIAVFVLGLFPDEPMSKTELAARQYQHLVAAKRTGTAVANGFRSARNAAHSLESIANCGAASHQKWKRAHERGNIVTAMLPETSCSPASSS